MARDGRHRAKGGERNDLELSRRSTLGVLGGVGTGLFAGSGSAVADTGTVETAATNAIQNGWVDYHDIDDYGADPTGQTPSDDAIEAAIDELEDGEWLVMTNGTYLVEGQHWIPNHDVTICGYGSKIINRRHVYGAYEAPFMVGRWTDGNVPWDQHGTNAESIEEGQDYIVVEEGQEHHFEPGTDLLISESKYTNEPYFAYGGDTGRGTAPTRTIVRRRDGRKVFLHRSGNYDHAEGNAGIWEIDAVKRPRILGMEMHGDRGEYFLYFFMCREGLMYDCHAENYTSFPFTTAWGYNTKLVDCTARNAYPPSEERTPWRSGSALNSSYGEPFWNIASTDVTIVRPTVDDCRRAIDVTAGSKVVRVYDPQITNVQHHGICFHSNPRSQVYGAYEVYGGLIEAKANTDPTHEESSKANHGWAASLSPNQSWVKIDGTTLVGKRAAVQAPYGRASDVTITNATLRTGYPESHDGDAIPSRSVVYFWSGRAWEDETSTHGIDHLTIDNCVLEGQGLTNRAMDIRGNNVDVDATIRGDFQQDVISVQDSRNVSLDITVDGNDHGNTNSSASDVRVNDQVENLDVSGVLQGAGRSVALSGDDVEGVAIEGARCGSDEFDDVIGYADAPDSPSVSNVRVLNTDVLEGSIDVSDASIDGLWIKNCRANAIRTPSSEDGARKFVRDNYRG